MLGNSRRKGQPKNDSRERSRADKKLPKDSHKAVIMTLNDEEDPFFYEVMNFRNNKTTRQKDRDKRLSEMTIQKQPEPTETPSQSALKKEPSSGNENNQLNLSSGMIEETKQASVNEERKQRTPEAAPSGPERKVSIFGSPSDMNLDNLSRFLGRYSVSLYLTKEEVKKDIRGLKGNTSRDNRSPSRFDRKEPSEEDQ